MWAAAARGLSTPEGDALAEALVAEKNWRFKYDAYATRLAELQSSASHAACVASCRAGLAALHDTFDFCRDDDNMKVSQAMRTLTEPVLFTGTIKGVAAAKETTKKAPLELVVDGGKTTLSGDELVARVQQWAEVGSVEPDVVKALQALNANAEKWAGTDLSSTVFVLLGGASEMCPLAPLLARGATVACVARGSARLKAAAALAAASPGGTLYVPRTGSDASSSSSSSPSAGTGDASVDEVLRTAGADLVSQTPEIRTWLASLEPGKRLIIGSYAYLDGEAHVRVSLAMDAIAADLVATRGGRGP